MYLFSYINLPLEYRWKYTTLAKSGTLILCTVNVYRLWFNKWMTINHYIFWSPEISKPASNLISIIVWLDSNSVFARHGLVIKESCHLSDDDFLPQDLHGVVHPWGFLSHQNHLPKRAFTQQLQVIEVIHRLKAQTTTIIISANGGFLRS